jgi:hypothetical protein
MNRRDFFKKAAILAAGVVAADQLELLEKLGHSKIWTGTDFTDPYKTDRLAFTLLTEVQGPDGLYYWMPLGIDNAKVRGFDTRIMQVSDQELKHYYKHGHPIF